MVARLDERNCRTHDRTLRQRSRYPILFMALGVCVVCPLVVGCPAVIPYQPNDGLIDALGLAPVQQRLKTTLLRALSPRVDAVDITEDFLSYRLHRTTIYIRVFFESVDWIELFNNHYVFLRGHGRQVIAKILCSNAEDSKMFADLIASFQARFPFSKQGAG